MEKSVKILFDEEQQIFSIHTKNTTYQIGIGKYGYLLHLYYGKRIKGDMSYLLTHFDRGFVENPFDTGMDRTFSLDALPQEYPSYGTGDFRTPCINVKNADGTYSCDLRYQSHKIIEGKYHIPGLPAVYSDIGAMTLEIELRDKSSGLVVTLYYGTLMGSDMITRTVSVKNEGIDTVYLEKVVSGCLDFVSGDFDVIHFHGRHGMERIMERTPMIHGNQTFGSIRGASSHQQNPFLMVAEKGTTEDAGNCYAMSLLYSGNFKAEAELDQFNQSRILMGISNEMFSYELKCGETFFAPEVVFGYSDKGLTDLSQQYHELIRNHICRGKYKTTPRPILINNWEATYFDFNGEKIINIAKQAARLGVEMLVLDDGWFGERDSDCSSLGDWFVNETKMGGPLSNVVEQVNALGMKFGLWIEPEMISENSKLYEEHADWVFMVPGRKPIRGRYQMVLDFSRSEVVDYIFDQITKVIDAANIEYIKMDMNRSITDIYSATAKHQNQGEILHHYVLGVYDFLERLLSRYQNLLIEGCCGGGGRFDAGMLYYTPQIWCSDNTDAIERIKIQYGTSFGYPISSVGSHVSAVPNHQTGRTTNIHTRGVVAMAGSFGYELDLNTITEEEKIAVRQQIIDYKKYWSLIHNGLYFRLNDPLNHAEYAAWEFVADDQSEALLNVVTLDTHCNAPVSYVKLKGINPDWFYHIEGEDEVYSGSALMYGGIPIPKMDNEYEAWQVHFVKC